MATATAIASRSCISSGTLVLVSGLAMFERSNGRNDHWEMHMQGLKELVQYYGGLESLYSQPGILQKIFRADLYGSLDDDVPTYFDAHDLCTRLAEAVPADIFFHNNADVDSDTQTTLRSVGLNRLTPYLDPTLVRCAHQLEEAVMSWDSMGGFEASEVTAPEAAASAEYVISTAATPISANRTTITKRPSVAAAMQMRYRLTGIQYMLVSSVLRQKLESVVEVRGRRLGEMVRICLVLFSLSILDERPMDATYALKLVAKLKGILEEEAFTVATEIEASAEISIPVDLQLWAIFLAVSVTHGGTRWPDKTRDDDETSWMLDAFTSRLTSSEYDSSDSNSNAAGADYKVLARLCQYLWVPCIHDKLFQWMWFVPTTSTRARVTELGPAHSVEHGTCSKCA
ncbi:hypothetical protein SEUCBS139899_004309 [Sporothrix eucalyptigena]